MPIPDYQSLMLPLLELLGDGKPHAMRELTDALAARFLLSEAERAEQIPSGTQALFDNRVGWAKSYMKQAGLIEYPARATARITEAGKVLLATRPERLDNRVLSQYPSFVAFRDRSRASKPQDDDSNQLNPDPAPDRTSLLDPSERIAEASRELRASVEADLLERVRSVSPRFFERIVVDLLLAMGYGGSRVDAGRAVGQSGDGGIDGIINEDRLGLDVIYLQAKRWEATVGRPEIQKFVGALQGVRASKGVFITTSNFTKDARDYAKNLSVKIILIDGSMLAALMFDHGVGVTRVESFEVKRVDGDYFEEL